MSVPEAAAKILCVNFHALRAHGWSAPKLSPVILMEIVFNGQETLRDASRSVLN